MLVSSDTSLLLLQDIWAGADELYRDAALACMARRGLPKDPGFANAVVQLWHALHTSMGVALLGPPGCGKSTCLALCQVPSLPKKQ